MAQQNRSKEIWLIPKRVNLHQTICLIDGIIERKYNDTTWNPQKQNNLGVNLKKWGATRDGRNISPQAIRTLVASIPQYLGFTYINTAKTPNTICLTRAGLKLWEQHKDELVKIPNLIEGNDLLITESDIVLHQMEKLQITNPIINKDCENIYVFPFRFMLKVLLKVNYLDKEEIAYFLFKVRGEDEVDLISQEILNFRKLPPQDRKDIINTFKSTHIGNITLVQAPSSAYFISLCQITGIIDKINITPDNCSTAIAALKIKDSYKGYVQEILNKKYKDIHTYNFDNNLQLWIDYIGTPERNYPPFDVSITNETDSEFLVQILQDGHYKYDDLIKKNDTISFPMFFNEHYRVKIIDIMTGEELDDYDICPTFDQREFVINAKSSNNSSKNETLEDIGQEIIEHCESRNFAGKTLNYLTTLSKRTGRDYVNEINLRGAYLEYFVYKMLTVLKDNNIIDDVVWNGHIGKYGIPVSAPGGRIGTPDIVFSIDDLHVVVELTTIKSKAQQFSAEGSSVPDHIRLYKEESGKDVVGVFCAPMIYERNTAAMQSTIASYDIELFCLTNSEFVSILTSNDRAKIKQFFSKQHTFPVKK
ncbi:MAG: AlwI family type II restriction endonuclease [Clostridia bacterium]|nr:AlwI family type II restriction endonuclease [Clostridia bacterium]